MTPETAKPNNLTELERIDRLPRYIPTYEQARHRWDDPSIFLEGQVSLSSVPEDTPVIQVDVAEAC